MITRDPQFRKHNWDFQGGFQGVANVARKGRDDVRFPDATRNTFADAATLAKAAFKADQAYRATGIDYWLWKATWCATQATALVSQATRGYAVGWVGRTDG